MKKTYEEPKIIIELFPGQDIVTFSGGSGGGSDDPPFPNGRVGSNDA